MKKKIGMLGVCMVLLLTGCGMPDAVADELKKVSSQAGFANGTKEEQDILRDRITGYEDRGEYDEAVTVSEQRSRDLDALAAYLEKCRKEKWINTQAEYDDGEYEEEIGEDGEVTVFHGLEEKEDPEMYFKELKEWRDFYQRGSAGKTFLGKPSSLSGSFDVDADKMQKFLEGMDEIGFKGLAVSGEEEEYNTHQVSRGVEFDINKNEDAKEYSVYYEFSEDSIAYPEKYADLLDSHMGNAFCLARVMCGGDLEFIAFRGSQGHPENHYSKNVEIYFKDKNVLQMNLIIQESYYDQIKSGFFTEQEREDLTGLLTWLTGDEKGAEAFLAGLDKSREKKGTLGNRTWYRTKHWGSGEEYIRFQ